MAGFFNKLKNLFTTSDVSEEFYEELEERLILSDVGMETAELLVANLKNEAWEKQILQTSRLKKLLKEQIQAQMSILKPEYPWENEKALLFITGVNGVGKTTSIGKLAYALKEQGKKVMLVAGDTFRAGAAEQLTIWAKRSGAEIVSQHEGADPSAVLFDGIAAAQARGTDVILCDTAGRLHNKKNLMAELEKMHRVVQKAGTGYTVKSLIVLDATTGQNALNQARAFSEVTDVDGIILTKLDGTAKGGVVMSVQIELGLPILYIGTGEKLTNLEKFDAHAFVEKMFEEED
ncbi:MAG: signal recognition particle-docking protein FtsY [Lachnospiraceae bacterium]|nr:signal recognition particle-docking protein FtsY [Lachnospiraceae bacterium]